MKIKFYTQFNRPPLKNVTYSPEATVFALVIENDIPLMKEVGKTNTQDMIECSCGYHTVNQLIERFKRGDVSALNSKAGFFGDITGAPDNVITAHKIVDSTFKAYNSLDKEVKDKFGSYDNFMKSFGDGSYVKILQSFKKETKKAVVDSLVSDLQGVEKVPQGSPQQVQEVVKDEK